MQSVSFIISYHAGLYYAPLKFNMLHLNISHWNPADSFFWVSSFSELNFGHSFWGAPTLLVMAFQRGWKLLFRRSDALLRIWRATCSQMAPLLPHPPRRDCVKISPILRIGWKTLRMSDKFLLNDKIWDEFGIWCFTKSHFCQKRNISSIIVSIHSALFYDVCWFASGLPGILES